MSNLYVSRAGINEKYNFRINISKRSQTEKYLHISVKGPVTRSDIRKRSNQIMKEKNMLRVSFAYLIV